MGFWTTKIVAALLLPPTGPLLLTVIGLVMARLWRRFGLSLAALGVLSLWLLATPLVSERLLRLVEPAEAPAVSTLRNAQAIVILGGGTYFNAPEYGGDTAGTFTLE